MNRKSFQRLLVIVPIVALVVLVTQSIQSTQGATTLSRKSSAVAASTTPTSAAELPTSTTTDVTSSTQLPTSPTPHSVTYPDPYRPGYSTLQQLVDDSSFVVTGTLVAPLVSGGATGIPSGSYVINVDRSFGPVIPRTILLVSPAEVAQFNLNTNSRYLFFYTIDPIDSTSCITGGQRGVFSYDPGSSGVARTSTNSNSNIPKTSPIDAFVSQVNAAEAANMTRPITNPPPACSASATGLN